MGGIMRPIPFTGMLTWMAGEYEADRSIFGIPESCFFSRAGGKSIRVFDETCDTPVGPAAGPHTQLAQNIVASYLAGGRFFELKTVQKLDSLEIEKPCIDAYDEGYNTEWSTELSLEQAFDEYVKAWILLHFMEAASGIPSGAKRSFIFNMSVGYDLAGIKTERMEAFITGLSDASDHPVFKQHMDGLHAFIENGGFSLFAGLNKGSDSPAVSDISPRIARSVTLSTMHGCPPDEIERIATYLMGKKGLNTYVKLNPTLLGYEQVREMIDALGFNAIELEESAFTRDLRYEDALTMLKRLQTFARGHGCGFGVKLSNTLGTVNTRGILPGKEMYMSGRALFPLTITLAARLSEAFSGKLPISYSGGASQLNIRRIFETGIRPITAATDLLKPGGYLRLAEMAKILEPLDIIEEEGVDVLKLQNLARDTLRDPYYKKKWRGEKMISVGQKLPIFDCYIAPCVDACPIRQDVPEYIRSAGDGDFDASLRIIYDKNPLPRITGYICDHRCMENCSRLDYEGPVLIRDVKRIAAQHGSIDPAERGFIGIHSEGEGPIGPGSSSASGRPKVAVLGAGPAGLSASYFLSKLGFSVTVFEKKDSPGGAPAHVLPHFRIPAWAIEGDIAAIRALGVDFRFGVKKTFSIVRLKQMGFIYVFIGIGAEKSKRLHLEGDNENIYEALDFLGVFNRDVASLRPGRRIAVIGGGNTAMDSARAAKRLSGVEDVRIIYRRTEVEMPADREEFDSALADGVLFMPLLRPESFSREGILTCRRMVLGESDKDGRRRPVPIDKTEVIAVDSIISAIGEYTDPEVLKTIGLKPEPDGTLQVNSETLETEVQNVFIGGDAYRGPSTVVESIADAKRASFTIAGREIPGSKVHDVSCAGTAKQAFEIMNKKGRLVLPDSSGSDAETARKEALRCLECSLVCNKCVDVCPNRANVAIVVDAGQGFRNIRQILHLDALCNECGNCGSFCPYDGLPYRDKITLFATKEDFENSTNSGFAQTGQGGNGPVVLRLNGRTLSLEVGADGCVLFGNVWKNGSDSEWKTGKGITEAAALIQAVLKDYRYLIDTFYV